MRTSPLSQDAEAPETLLLAQPHGLIGDATARPLVWGQLLPLLGLKFFTPSRFLRAYFLRGPVLSPTQSSHISPMR